MQPVEEIEVVVDTVGGGYERHAVRLAVVGRPGCEHVRGEALLQTRQVIQRLQVSLVEQAAGNRIGAQIKQVGRRTSFKLSPQGGVVLGGRSRIVFHANVGVLLAEPGQYAIHLQHIIRAPRSHGQSDHGGLL